MTMTKTWQNLTTPEIGDHSSAASRQLAAEIEAAIESIQQQRELCDATEAKFESFDAMADPEKIDSDARAFRVSVVKAMQAEIAFREMLSRWFDLDVQDMELATAQWQRELAAALDEAREALRNAGFGHLLACEQGRSPKFDDEVTEFREQESRIKWLLYSWPKAAELVSKVEAVRSYRADRFRDNQENRRLEKAVQSRLMELQRSMVAIEPRRPVAGSAAGTASAPFGY